MGVSSSPAVTLLRQRYGNVTWDGILRGSGLLALTAIPVVLYSPRIGELVAFLLITLWVNGPLSPFLPTTYEPVLMLFGRVYPPILIGGLGILGTLYVEYLNYHLYQRVLGHSALKGMRRSNVIRGTIKLFQRAPFFTVWLCSWSPLPYWAVRFPVADDRVSGAASFGGDVSRPVSPAVVFRGVRFVLEHQHACASCHIGGVDCRRRHHLDAQGTGSRTGAGSRRADHQAPLERMNRARRVHSL